MPGRRSEIGLVNQLSSPASLMEDAMAFAERLAARPPIAVSCVLKAVSAWTYEGMQKGLAVEEEGSRIVGASEDRKEGFAAFIEKRKPVFKGK